MIDSLGPWGLPAAALHRGVLLWTLLLLAGVQGGLAVGAERRCLDGAVPVRVSGVPGARSLELSDGRVLRIAGLEPFDLIAPGLEGAEAALRNRIGELALGQPVSALIAGSDGDRYGRYPALIGTEAGLLQETLAREGLAVAFASGDPIPCFDRILAAEATARNAARGYWPDSPLPVAEPEALAAWIGRFVIFEGDVLSVGNRAARTYLNFGTLWSEDVTVEIEARDRKSFGGEEALSALVGRQLRVRGFLESKAGPMLAIRSPMQLEILGGESGERGRTP